MLIYIHTCTITNKSYIGQTIFTMEYRLKEHINNAKNGVIGHFYNAIRKYGIENFSHDVLELDIKTRLQLNKREIYWIEYYGTFKNGYNLNEGGSGNSGYTHSLETKNKISKANKVALNKPETKHKIIENNKYRNPMKDKKHSETTRDKMSKTHMGHEVKLSTRKKISESRKGIIITAEHREKISMAKKGISNIKLKGKKQRTIICPKCKKEGGISAMKGHHGEFGEKCIY